MYSKVRENKIQRRATVSLVARDFRRCVIVVVDVFGVWQNLTKIPTSVPKLIPEGLLKRVNTLTKELF